MRASGIPGIGFDENGLPDGTAPESDRLAWSFAAPFIVATSLGLWAAIGEGLAVLIG